MKTKTLLSHSSKRGILAIAILAVAVFGVSFLGLLVGSSHLSLSESLSALFGSGTPAAVRIVRAIRFPRVVAALVAGAGLSVSGLVMQTCLNNPLASPSTLGVSNAAVFGANLSIIAFAGGFLSTGHNLSAYAAGANPYATSALAFVFAAVSVLLILGLCHLRAFEPGVVVLAGVAIGAIWTAATTVLQFYATDVGLSAAVIWTFGDLGRATWRTDAIMGAVAAVGLLVFGLLSMRLNALLGGDAAAKSFGVNVRRLRFICLFLGSLITAVCVSYLGVIGFLGVICPHAVKRILGQDHRVSVPASALTGSLLLLLADTASRSIGNGAALPVGAITSLLGAPFFLYVIFSKKEARRPC